MKILIGSSLLQKMLQTDPNTCWKDVLANLIGSIGEQQLEVVFGWPSLFEYLDCGSMLKDFPLFDDHNSLFKRIKLALVLDPDNDQMINFYDELFVECLNLVRSIPLLDRNALLEKIRVKESTANEIFSVELERYKQLLTDDPYRTIHDLTLYLAWDRVCVNLAMIFEHNYQAKINLASLEVLKECLIESFQHIAFQGKTSPSFFRLIEAIYALDMRNENLDLHTDSDWILLCQSSQALALRDAFINKLYVDNGVIDDQSATNAESVEVKVLTLEPTDKVKASLLFTRFMMDRLRRDVPNWIYGLMPLEIVCLEEVETGLIVDAVLSTQD